MYGYDVIRDFFIKGGPVLWPLVACSLMLLTITIERMLFWWRTERRNRQGAYFQV
jgi:biopolymer transport protein ExbB